jgi:hypothetical protein
VTLIKGRRTPEKGTKTHVLIIGVNDYPNATASRIAGDYSAMLGVSQLSSPAVSARALAEWFLTEFHNPVAHLGSLELLLSEKGEATYRNKRVEKANFKNIKAAFQRWAARCDSSEDNTGVFYFSGHGAEGYNQILLPSDFPVISTENNLPDWDQVIDFNSTRVAMQYCKAVRQFYFVDCCRTRVPPSLASQKLGTTLYYPGLVQSGNAAQAVYTVEDRTTGAARGQISGFTALLLHSLRGAAAQWEDGNWHVASEALSRACQRIREVFVEDFTGEEEALRSIFPSVKANIELSSAVGRLILHQYRRNTPPAVPVRVTCNREDAACPAKYFAVRRTETVHLTWNRRQRHAHARLTPGRHEFRIHFSGGACHRIKKSVEPPVCELHHRVDDV